MSERHARDESHAHEYGKPHEDGDGVFGDLFGIKLFLGLKFVPGRGGHASGV